MLHSALTIQLHRIVSLQDDLLFPWLDLYETAFPQIERIPVSSMLRGIRRVEFGEPARSEYLAALDDTGVFVGMAQWTMNPDFGAAYLGYFAILPDQRSRGLGAQFYRLLFDRVSRCGALLLAFDVEQPERQSNPTACEIATRRIRFYQRQGAGLVKGLEFFYGDPPMRQYVMIHPIQPLALKNLVSRVRGVVTAFGGRLEEIHPGASTELAFYPVDGSPKIDHNST